MSTEQATEDSNVISIKELCKIREKVLIVYSESIPMEANTLIELIFIN